MARLLRIDSSPRTEGSHSRKIADEVERLWRDANPGGDVVVRDLTDRPVPHVDQRLLTAISDPDYRTKDDQRAIAALSDELVAELKSADELLISAPMYNFTVPSVLKAWIDHIVRWGLTFDLDANGYRGLLDTKRAILVTAAGGQYHEPPAATMDHLTPYLETVLRFIGVKDITAVRVEGTAYGKEAAAASEATAAAAVAEIF